MRRLVFSFLLGTLFLWSCEDDNNNGLGAEPEVKNYTSADYSDLVEFTQTSSSAEGLVYEVLPGPAALNPEMNPTPFSDNIYETSGAYSLEVSDVNAEDSQSSQDAVKSVNIQFTGNDGTQYLIDEIRVIHKPEGAGDHTFFGGVGLNKTMHGSTGIGESLMPRMLSYITLWGLTDLKDAATGEVLASDRIIHIMSATNVRDENLKLVDGVDVDKSDYNFRNVQTHIILPPKDTQDNLSPVPGTAHGFLHMMFEDVVLEGGQRDWKLAYEVLPGPAAVNPQMNPTPFSNRVAVAAGSYELKVNDATEDDTELSEDEVELFNLTFKRQNGQTFIVDNVDVIHKAEGSGDHTFFGGVGIDKLMHGDTGIGNMLMPKMTSYITVWGIADLKNGNGDIIAENRFVHIMTGSRVRDENLELVNGVSEDLSDYSTEKIETHIIFPPFDTEENASPVPGTRHGFLHIMFEEVSLSSL